MVSAGDVVHLYRQLAGCDIPIWLIGGWGIDALLGQQTRPHKDLDVLMRVDDVARLREMLGRDGYGLKELWSENRWTVDARGVETATAFVLRDAQGRELDAHALRLDAGGHGVPAWEVGDFVFSPEDLSGEGLVAGLEVRCLSAGAQVVCHTGYALPDKHRRDLERLCERFGLAYPGPHARTGPL